MFAFLGIGAQKAGTTWLYSQLRQHPELGFPLGKEVHFWNTAPEPVDIECYLARFCDANRKEGEITPAYAMLPQAVIRDLHRCSPDLRLIYILRNPIERAWSSALMALGRAEMAIHEASDQWFIDHFRSAGSLTRGDYEQCLRNWRDIFDHEQVLVLRHEHIQAAPERLLNACFQHLGVAAIGVAQLQRWRCRERVFAGPGNAMRPALRIALRNIYEAKIDALERYLDEDLREWRT